MASLQVPETALGTSTRSGKLSEVPETVHKDAREAAQLLLNSLLTGAKWPGNIRRSAEETPLANPLSTPSQIENLLSMVELEGSTKPFLPLPFRISEMMTGLHMTIAVLANLIGLQRGIEPQTAVVDTEHATLSASGHFLVEIDGKIVRELWKEGLYEEIPGGAYNPGLFYQMWNQHFVCKDGRAIFLYQKRDPVPNLLKMLKIPDAEIPALMALADPKISTTASRSQLQRRLTDHIRSTWNSFDLEAQIMKTRVGAGIVPRSRTEFMESPQGRAVGWRPPMEYFKTESPEWKPVPFGPLTDPKRGLLEGIKVVELTRALMGSRIGTVLGYMGATVVKATSPQMADYGILSAAHNVGKMSSFLDLSKAAELEQLKKLIKDADVFISNFALGALDRLGLGYNHVLEMIKGRDRGIVYCEGNAFGFHGPFANAAGFEHLNQALTGMAWAQGINHGWDQVPEGGHMPAVVPVNFIDKGTGHIGAVGALVGLLRRASEGGSWQVQMSLAQSAGLIQEWGLYPGLDLNDTTSRNEKHWLHSSVWPKYPKERLFPDPDAWNMYITMVAIENFPTAHPPLTNPHFFERYRNSPFGDTKILKPPLATKSFKTTPMRYRCPPRPIGHDQGITDWEVAEKRLRELEKTMVRVDYAGTLGKVTAKL